MTDEIDPELLEQAAELAAKSIIKLARLQKKTKSEKLENLASFLGLDSDTLKGRPATFKNELSLEDQAIKDSLPIDYQTAYHKAKTEPYVAVNTYYGKKIRAIYQRLQDDKCAFCFLDLEGDTVDLDHSHKTGMIRGVVHHRCNLFFGFTEKAAERIGRSIEETCDMLKAYLIIKRDE